MSVRVALVGCGRWGQNLLRTLSNLPEAHLVAVADTSPARRDFARSHAPAAARVVPTLEDALALGATAIVLATPTSAHAAMALAALEAGADVFVEKPLALTAADAELCAARAAALGRVGMVGHLLRYHPAVERLIELAQGGHLGPLRRLSASRLSVRGDRTVSALWSLGPHDLSVLHALEHVDRARLEATFDPGGDPMQLSAWTEGGIEARVELSRASATKERRISVVGAARAALLDDVRAPDRLFLSEGSEPSAGPLEEVHVPFREPLVTEMEHFVRCVAERRMPRTSFEEGAAVVRALARAERTLMANLSAEAPPAIAAP